MSKSKGRRAVQPTRPPQSPDIDGTFQKALALHQRGILDQAEGLYRAVLERAPDHFNALHLLGAIAFQREDHDAAVALLGRAVKLDPNFASAHSNLGLALGALKRHEEALACFDRALTIEPRDVETLNNRGLALHELGRLEEALTGFDRALSIEPRHAGALNNRGLALRDLKRPQEALASYDRALTVRHDLVEVLFNRGNALRDLKRPDEAVASYDRALATRPNQIEVLINRGNALRDLKRHEEALASLDRALALRPGHAEALNNRGNVLHDLKRYEEALASYDHALAIKPDHVEALNNRGNALQSLGRFEDALASHDRALAIKPDHAETLNGRGNALRALKRLEEALASFDRALAIRPDYSGALNNRGLALCDVKRPEEAIASYDRALAIAPDHAEALFNRGNALCDLKRPEEALASFDRALAIAPAYAEALNNRGNVLRDLMRAEEALVSYDRALWIKPDYAEALSNRGNALQDLKRPGEALACYDRALAIKPDFADALYNRGNALNDLGRYEEAAEDFERLLGVRPDYDYARGDLLFSRLHGCDWNDYARNVALIASDVAAGKRAAKPFVFLSVSQSPRDQQHCAEACAKDKYPLRSPSLWTGERYGHERVRVAYLSADFRNHPVAHLTAGLFEAHDRRHFETTALSFGPGSGDEIRARLENSFDRFIDARRMSDRDAARTLRELEIDIAVDLNGYTQDCRPGILALRPAPVQASFLGYPGTMGAAFVDYILADRTVIPDEDQRFYAEKVASLPDTFMPSDDRRRIAERTPSRADAGLPETGFVFCAFTNAYKIVPPVFEVWMRLLRRVEGSVLWLRQDHAAAMGNLRREAERRGVDPGRLVFAPRVDKMEDHLARQRLAGVLLDTLPYNAHATASDALWAGLPVVTCLGTAFAGRVAASLLGAVGLPDLIAGTLDAYEALALELARDRDLLASIKEKLARHRDTAPLFDTARFCRHIETAYDTMAQRSQRGEPPESFKVAPHPAR